MEADEDQNPRAKRFLFMYYGRKLDTTFFHGKFGLASVEGTTDDRGCHFVFLQSVSRIRSSQLAAAIGEYNTCVPGAIRLQEEPYQSAIITMSSRRMEGVIYMKIQRDKDAQCQNYWVWNPVESEGEAPLSGRRKRTASSSGEELRQTTLELELQKTTPVAALERENAQLKRDLASADKNSDSLSDELDKLRGMYEVLVMRNTNLGSDNAFLRSRLQPGDRISVLEAEVEELRRECWGYKMDLERREALKPSAVDTRVKALEEERVQLLMENITLKRRNEEQAKHARPYYPPPQTNHMAEAHLHEILALKKQFGVERDALNARLAAMHAELFMEDGEKWADFFKRRYYSQMVCDPETGEPRVCPLTGEARSKAAHYETERNEALAKLLELRQRMPSDETTALLGRAQEKARKFKRRYKFLKTYLHEHQYMSDLLDGFCDSDKGNASESDDDLRPTGPRCVVVAQDVGVPFGFAVRPEEKMGD